MIRPSVVLALGLWVLSLCFAPEPSISATQYLVTEPSASLPDSLVDAGKAPEYSHSLTKAKIRLWLHVLCRSDGTGGLAPADVDSLLSTAEIHLGQLDVSFIVAGQDSLSDDTYFYDPAAYASSLYAENAHSNAIDIYLGPTTGYAEGRVESIPGSALVLTGDLESNSALSHLLGNCLGLYDTDETAFGTEAPDGSNAGSAGDLVSDTSADPGLMDRVLADCTLGPAFDDSLTAYSPDAANIMSNSPTACWAHFTAGQRDRVLAAIETYVVLQDVTADLPPSSGYVGRTAQTGLSMIAEYPEYASSAVGFDFSGDGDKDLLVVGHAAFDGDENLGMAAVRFDYDDLYNVPVFQSVTDNRFPSGGLENGAKGVLLADYDNDGDLDFYVPRPDWNIIGYSRQHSLYRNDNGSFTDVMLGTEDIFPVGERNLQTSAASWGDYDGDGFVDLLVSVSTSENPDGEPGGTESTRLFHNVPVEGGGPTERRFEVAPAGVGLNSTLYERILSMLWVDLDQDHDLDVVLIQFEQNDPTQPERVYSRYLRNLGGIFADVTEQDFPASADFQPYETEHRGSFLATAGDVDNDGFVDIIYHGKLTRGYLKNNYDAVSGLSSLSRGYYDYFHDDYIPFYSVPTGICALDYDLNGTLDLVYSNNYPGATGDRNFHRVIENTGSAEDRFVDHLLYETVGDDQKVAQGLGAADWNMDGFTELLVAGIGDQTAPYFAADAFFDASAAFAGVNNWIGIRLNGFPNGATAGVLPCNSRGLGATVIVHRGSDVQAQVVDGGSGNASQHDLDLSFGLGTYSGDVVVEVLWPCGQTQELTYSASDLNTYHTITLDPFEVVENSVNTYYMWHPAADTQTWGFEWRTSGVRKEDESWIEFPGGAFAPLYETGAGVTFLKMAFSDNVLYHRLEWTGPPCNVSGDIPFEIHTRSENETAVAAGVFHAMHCPYSHHTGEEHDEN